VVCLSSSLSQFLLTYRADIRPPASFSRSFDLPFNGCIPIQARWHSYFFPTFPHPLPIFFACPTSPSQEPWRIAPRSHHSVFGSKLRRVFPSASFLIFPSPVHSPLPQPCSPSPTWTRKAKSIFFTRLFPLLRPDGLGGSSSTASSGSDPFLRHGWCRLFFFPSLIGTATPDPRSRPNAGRATFFSTQPNEVLPNSFDFVFYVLAVPWSLGRKRFPI